VPVDVDVEEVDRLPEPVEAAAYYVVSEALTNVARYAGAETATLHVTQDDERLLVEVCDDGVGGAQISGGSGLQGLRDRVEAIGGRLELHSPPGGGTCITAHLPFDGRRDG
jgi:signal transduction histidine kinase